MKSERTKEEILVSHCPSMSLLFLDDQGMAFRERVLKAMEEYRQSSPVESKWVSVNEQAPPDYKRVLWIDNRDNMINLGYFVWSQTPVDYCTHWQPLPELPIEETKEK